MTEEITLELINEKIETIIDKEDLIIEILETHTTSLNNIIEALNTNNTTTTTIPATPIISSEFKTELQAKIDEGLPYDEVKELIIETLTSNGIYSEDDINIKLFTDINGDIILEVKSRPYKYWGKLLQFLQDSMGEADKFETSRYEMKTIQWWKITKNQQMETQTSTTDIVDGVNDDWGDKDDVGELIGNDKIT